MKKHDDMYFSARIFIYYQDYLMKTTKYQNHTNVLQENYYWYKRNPFTKDSPIFKCLQPAQKISCSEQLRSTALRHFIVYKLYIFCETTKFIMISFKTRTLFKLFTNLMSYKTILLSKSIFCILLFSTLIIENYYQNYCTQEHFLVSIATIITISKFQN